MVGTRVFQQSTPCAYPHYCSLLAFCRCHLAADFLYILHHTLAGIALMTESMISPASHRDRITLRALIFGTCAPPFIWFCQELLNYGLTATICYRGDHPTTIHSATMLRGGMIAF